MNENNCDRCRNLYKVSETGYFTHWCKVFKCWLLPDAQKNSLRAESCIILDGRDEK